MTPHTALDEGSDANAPRAATSWPSTGALVLGHVAGMIDLAALPVWVGVALIGRLGLSPQVAGGMVTVYLLCVVAASLWLGPRVPRLAGRFGACGGFGLALVAFLLMLQPLPVAGLMLLHGVAGLGAGVGLTFVHGAIGRSANPHRVFAAAQAGLGVSAVLFMGVAPALIAVHGGTVLFVLFALIMGLALLANAVFFPVLSASRFSARGAVPAPIPVAARWAMLGVTLMGLVQAGLFSFVERIGVDEGYGAQVNAVLIAVGLVNLLPAPLAGLLQRRLSAQAVARAGPLAQALLALVIVASPGFWPYAVAAALFIAVMIFTHTFVFGWLALLDPSGRAVAMTPAVLMSGAAMGPLLSGVLVQQWGYLALGAALAGLACVALISFVRADRRA